MIYIRLFWEFFKVGLFSVGGGMATLPFLYNISEETGWFTKAQVADMLAVSESTPGPIAINMATYVGYTVGGVPGSLAASAGLVVPGIVLILIITRILSKFRDNKYVEGAFYGIRPASVGLIAAAGLMVCEITFLEDGAVAGILNGDFSGMAGILDWKAVILAAVLLVLTRWFKPTKGLHPVIFIAFSAVIGIVFSFAGA